MKDGCGRAGHALRAGSTIALCIFFLFLLPLSVISQVPVKGDSIEDSGEDLGTNIEDAMTDLETDDQTDWTVFTDQLDDWRRRPLDLNDATEEDLQMLPGLSPILITNFLAYREKFGPLLSVYELQAIRGMSHDIFWRIRPFITVRSSREKDIRRATENPSGPSIKEILENSREEVTLRTVTTVEPQVGYSAPDTNSNGSLSTRYLGNPMREYFRFRSKYAQNFSLCILGEKDQGEKLMWDPSKKTYGFDFYSAHFALRDYGRLKRFVIGDYNLQVGQGLLFSSGLGFGKGTETIFSIKRSNYGVKPYSSVNENNYLRGMAATVAWKKFWFTGFLSRTARDGNVISQNDTLTSDVQYVSTLQTGGNHRTASELADKGSVKETIWGGRAEYKSTRLMVGLTQAFYHYDPGFQASTKPYQKYYFSGTFNYNTALDFDWTWRNFNVFGELGRSKSGGTGLILGSMVNLDKKLDISLHFRDLGKSFHSDYGYVFSDRPTTTMNERGVYLGMKAYPIRYITLSGFFDKYWFPWEKSNAAFPSQGHEWMTQVDYNPNKVTALYVRLRSDHKEQNASLPSESTQLKTLIPVAKTNLRFQFSQKVDKFFSLRTRLEFCWYNRKPEVSGKGVLFYQDVSAKVLRTLDLTARYAIFDVNDYNARIYAYENDIPGVYSIPGYQDKGSRYYLIVNWKPLRNLEVWLRWSQSIFTKEKTVGSGLDEIQGNTKSELKLQARYVF